MILSKADSTHVAPAPFVGATQTKSSFAY